MSVPHPTPVSDALQPEQLSIAPALGIDGPSRLYRAFWWRLGKIAAYSLPRAAGAALARRVGHGYSLSAPQRFEIVTRNLSPALHHDVGAARQKARELFEEFAVKLVDLWRYEAGQPHPFNALEGWEHFQTASARKRGVLLLTIHLGNWEFGAPLLTQRGVPLHVITLSEPDPRLGRLREAARARWGVRTLTLSDDPFGMINVIRHLEANETVALLMDRPPPATATPVRLFGQPFAASVAAAELARATGCALLPVCLPRTPAGYTARILPEIEYDRPLLRQAEERVRLTQRILSAFEPLIRVYLNQWYHFVPIWPDPAGSDGLV